MLGGARQQKDLAGGVTSKDRDAVMVIRLSVLRNKWDLSVVL